MNFRELSEIAGCSEKTVRKWAKTLWPERVYRPSEGACLSDSDALSLMSKLPKRSMVSSGKSSGSITASEISAIVAETLKQVFPLLQAQSIQPQKTLPAHPIASRDELRRIVNRAANESGDYSGTWNRLYQEVYYRLHINAKTRAENCGIQALDIIEDQGLLADTIAIAREIFN